MRALLLRFLAASIAAAPLAGCAEATDPTLLGARDGGALPDSGVPGDDGSTTPPGDGDTPPTDTGGGGGDGGCSVPTGKVCTMVPQCGCASGQSCDVTKTDGTTSCVAAGTRGRLEGCDDIGQCEKGLSCIGGLCNPQCSSNADCPTGTTCDQVMYRPTGATTSEPVPGFKVCLVSECDVLSPSAACGSANCALFDDGSSVCVKGGTGTSPGGCTASDPFLCAPGYVCTNDTDCFKWCRVGFSSDCSGTLGTCTGFTTPIYVGGIEYGVCAY